jgi:preprotein translocase subunit SecA
MRNFEIRKHLLDFDNVMNKQREVVYAWRDEILKGENLTNLYNEASEAIIDQLIEKYTAEKYPENWQWEELKAEFGITYLVDLQIPKEEISKMKKEILKEKLLAVAKERFLRRKEELGEETFNELIKFVFLRTLDIKWQHLLRELDTIREGINWRAYGHQDPLIEYQKEAYNLFQTLMFEFYKESVTTIFRIAVAPKEGRAPKRVMAYKPTITANPDEQPKETVSQTIIKEKKVGRNDPCPCGSGKKYKKCCGKNK